MQQNLKASSLISRLNENDLPQAEQLMRVAFSKFLGIEDPSKFSPGTSLRGRLITHPDAVFGAYNGDELVGAIFGSVWGTFGYFGPLVVHPDAWGQGIAQKLTQKMVEFFDGERLTATGLYTFSNSVKHVSLYQKFGYWPQYLTGNFAKDVSVGKPAASITGFSGLKVGDREDCLKQADNVTDSIYEGLSLRAEIQKLEQLDMGETILLLEKDKLAGFAVCHYKPNSEASTGTCYVKFGAVGTGTGSRERFAKLLGLCEELAVREGIPTLVLSINSARDEAYRTANQSGFVVKSLGVAMLRPHAQAFNRPDAFVIDDWR